jgi:hypothetical protein
MSILATLKGVYVSQKVELFEAVTGIETENEYAVFAYDPQADLRRGRQGGGPSTRPLFIAREHSGCCARQCLGNARPFKMSLTATGTRQQLALLDRPLVCTCLCLCRPVLKVRFSPFLSLFARASSGPGCFPRPRSTCAPSSSN